ncbi:MAG: CDP-diacylglycerol--glycerol-3-phosphate 3-phosphatidyltransferase [Chlamydiae bacterium RIFCSPHIGHO2_12_FULL_49_11]|nr:MAG: CDP-diacylglycerol--glycerol-3-phosphate 3-phosphatidyltransferase [Chlamydiae bacterium RIFCSPHIGHO2_12_FULL_49_11]
MGLALFLTLSRLIIAPVFICLYLFAGKLGLGPATLGYTLLILIFLSELSDIFDGRVARRRNQVTELGKILDPMADSIARISVFLAFTQGIVRLPLLLVLLFVVRDGVISTLRTLCALRGIALAARTSGKIKAVLQGVAIFLVVLLMVIYGHGMVTLKTFRSLSKWIVGTVAIYTVFSAFEYVWTYRKFILESWRAPSGKKTSL